MKIVECRYERHAAAILAIFNDAILHSTALYDYEPWTDDSMVQWFRAKQSGGYPVIGIESDTGELLGFGSYGPFRMRPAYKYSVEHSVYVHAHHRGKGLGRRLLGEIIAAARKQDYHLLVGGIDAANTASIALHESMGFTHAGTIRQAGFKFGRWLDLAFYQLILETPAHPVDG
ncbi:MAG: N-acetyltransferase [Steroidobacteraceae bacterium]|nr:N-acetyltransferase [Steroidobacteraceae bacterium]